MKKTDVYVVVDTPKKAKKLKNLLDMFGENYGGCTFELLENKEGDKVYFNMGSEWNTDTVSMIHRRLQEVSIKELRNILAKEHLRPGDVVIAGIGKIRYVVKFEKIIDNHAFLEASKYLCIDDDGFTHNIQNSGAFSNFIRYATEEEKDLLDPNKEFEVGKWYKSWNDTHNGYDFSYYTGTGCDYGFHSSDCWFSEQYWIKNTTPSEWKEATPPEVEKALIDEAKRRGFVNGSIGNNSNIHNTNLEDCELFFNNEYEFDEKDNLLRVILDSDTTWTVFKDGQWATVIKQDNFTDSDIAIVERLHDALLYNHGYSLESKSLTDARLLANKIKSNIK